jgi:energy-converting hydrogenase B subunit Q
VPDPGGRGRRSGPVSPEVRALDLSRGSPPDLTLWVRMRDVPGALHQLTGVVARHRANIAHIDMTDRLDGEAWVYMELDQVAEPEALLAEVRGLDVVRAVATPPSFYDVYGKRVIVIGGGAQVGQVALGAISEADRHNIRGERISVDTIPLVGEENLAAAVRAVARLPRAAVLVLAGALMGGEVTQAVRELRERGIIVISLNMAGSVPDAADLVVTDPVQAGVMAVMAIARTAKFDVGRVRGRRF